MKTCPKCQTDKRLYAFSKDKNTKDGYQSWCNECKRIGQLVYYKKCKYLIRAGERLKYSRNEEFFRRRAKRKYGISNENYESMLLSQNGKCKICGHNNTNSRRLSIDHDHKTEKVRGLLCHACNVGLGHFRDDPINLFSAIKYLKESP